MGKVRGVRFTDAEEAQIEEFLKKNQIFDFSRLARLAIMNFISNPTFQLTPVSRITDKKERQNANPN